MGIFSRKKAQPAFAPPELPMAAVPGQSTLSLHRQETLQTQNGEPAYIPPPQVTFLGRRVSEAVPNSPYVHGHRQVLPGRAPSFSAHSTANPSLPRFGETDFEGHDLTMANVFNLPLTVDLADSDEELLEPATMSAVAQGKQPYKMEAKLGWFDAAGDDEDEPSASRSKSKGKKKSKKHHGDPSSSKKKRRHRHSRPTEETQAAEFESDEDEPAYRRRLGHKILSPVAGSLNSMDSMNSPPTQNAPGLLDTNVADVMLLNSAPRAVPVGDGFDALDVMADHIFRLGVTKKKWFKPPRSGKNNDFATGVSIRAKTGLYRTFPVGCPALDPFSEAITRLNPEIAIKIKCSVVTTVMNTYIYPTPSMNELTIDANTRIQILDCIEHLGRARKHQYAAFVRDEGVLCVWADHVENVVPAAEALELALLQFVWNGEDESKKLNREIAEAEESAALEAKSIAEGQVSIKDEDMDPEDLELRERKKQWRERPVRLIAPIIDGLVVMVCMALISLGFRKIIQEYMLDGGVMRFAFIILAPFLFCITSFAAMCIVGSAFQIAGPVNQVSQKSMYYSGTPPKRTTGELCHVTVQLPVYKESLDEVIRPTVESLKKAITTYERQGGSVGILVCDDGLQLLDKKEADRRRRFYFDNSIAYVARPGHGVDGFVRKGRFKKAGNMNFANSLSLRVEEIMDERRPACVTEKGADHFWSDLDENELYSTVLEEAVAETEGKAWAAGNIRIGEILLIIDSDTRVPEDCFADAVSEMAESPEVAIIQHMSGVMQVAHHYFENGVAHFTRGIQTAISYCCAGGEVAPFVGHNAFIRWSALQECAHIDDDGISKIWSESHVSEDFAIAVTLQIKGYVVRWATYSNGEFEEGVSLTCDDELNRWQKYAFGCSELIFHPFRQWFTKGPITPLFRQFIWSSIPLHSKFSICAYIFSYYAIAISWILTVANFFLVGLGLPLDDYYLPSWNVTLVCIVLFVGVCNVAFIVLRYRLKVQDCAKQCIDQVKWIPFFSIFFIGMSMPMGAALISHLVGYNMTWSATVKTVEKSNFFLQIPIIWKRFWPQLVFFTVVMAAGIIGGTSLIPAGYRMSGIEIWVPLGLVGGSHLLYPLALNPYFLSFSF